MRHFVTSTGASIEAPTKAAAAAIAAQYGMGEISRQDQGPPRPAAKMNLNRARTLAEEANEWPRCGQDWPMDAEEAQADGVIREVDPEYARYLDMV